MLKFVIFDDFNLEILGFGTKTLEKNPKYLRKKEKKKNYAMLD